VPQIKLDPSEFTSGSHLITGLLYSHNYIVVMQGPKADPGLISEKLLINAVDVSVSGLSLDMQMASLSSRPRFTATERSDQDLRISFLETHDMQVRILFEKWLSLAYNQKSKVRGYPDDFKSSSIVIHSADNAGKGSAGDVFINAVPYQINDLDYSVSNNSIIKTVVTFKFEGHLVTSDGSSQGYK